jgi:hypothetical protein
MTPDRVCQGLPLGFESSGSFGVSASRDESREVELDARECRPGAHSPGSLDRVLVVFTGLVREAQQFVEARQAVADGPP